MKIVIAPDSFKGSASSRDIAQWIESGIHSVIPDCETVKIAIGDGGEGSLDAVLSAGFSAHEVEVLGPVGNPVTAQIAIKGETAFIEMAQASGLSQLPGGVKDALNASSFGTGQLILAALDKGATEIILAIGGTATTDAGAGALQVLGAKLLDASGNEIAPGGAALNSCASIDTSGLDLRLAKVSFTLASDVTNPLLGDKGAARIFSPQKGASPEQVEVLEQSLSHFASLVGGQYASLPGSGAAGGFGFMAFAFLGAQASSGIDLILDLVDFDSHLVGADVVITGEGRFDSQSVQGKAPWGILKRAERLSIPTYLVCGDADTHQGSRYKGIYTLTSIETNIDKCIASPAPLVTQLGAQIAQSLKKF
ncbi:COG1929 Glycerate kinase [Candidatus Nanopelagicaceae bacterium]